MKPNKNRCCCPADFRACRLLVIALAVWMGCLPGLFGQAVPDKINYQGILLQGDGTPVPAAPTDVEFRIYDSPTATMGLQWGRMFRINPDTNGTFNVVLSGEGALLTGAPDTNLPSVFTGPGSDSRYLELTVAGSTPIRPRQRFVATPYAFLAYNVTAARQNFDVAGVLTVNGTANMGPLTVNGAANMGPLTVNGAANIGSLIVTGAAIAASFTGSGSGLTGINTNNLVQEVVQALCPPGTIIAFGGTNIPSGWLLCNGASVPRAVYPRLYNAIGTAWGNSTGGNTNFNLPDLRGMFLRGVNYGRTGTYCDPDATQRVVAVAGGNAGNNVGSVQTNMFLRHNHTNDVFSRILKISGYSTAASLDNTPGEPDLIGTADMLAAGGNETRPNNAYVNYIIKY